jgi:hypothetical protein
LAQGSVTVFETDRLLDRLGQLVDGQDLTDDRLREFIVWVEKQAESAGMQPTVPAFDVVDLLLPFAVPM